MNNHKLLVSILLASLVLQACVPPPQLRQGSQAG